MIAAVRKVRNLLWGYYFLWFAILSSSLLVGSIALRHYLDVSELLAYGIAIGIGLVISSILGFWFARQAVFGMQYLVSAVMAVVGEKSTVAAPDPNTLKSHYYFLNDVANHIYQLAGSQSLSETSSSRDSSIPNLTQLAVPAVALAADNSIIFANAAAVAYFASDQNAIIGKDMDTAFNFSFSGSDQTLNDWINYCKENKATASQSWDHVKHTLSDDSSRQFDMVAHYSKDNPHGYEVLLIFIDHTDRYDQEYRDVSFVAMAVHELRTPLTVMRGYIEVFEEEIGENLNDEQKQFLENMNAQSQQLANFVGNILNVARVEENQLHLKMRKDNWGDIVRKVVGDMELRARVQGLNITYSLPEELPEVAVDKVSMYEVLNNLLDNAIKYTHDNRPIQVAVTVLDENWVETTVTDQGIGIPDNVMKNLFKKFYRSYRSNKSAVGTGLGLYISKSLVNAQGGEIWAKSKEGQGSTFGFTVPTYVSVADKLNSEDNEIVREAHGWIKNHSLYRG